MPYRSSSAPIDPPREAVAWVGWTYEGRRYETIVHVSALAAIRDRVDWIAATHDRARWPHVEVRYWRDMPDFTAGKPCVQWETLLSPHLDP